MKIFEIVGTDDHNLGGNLSTELDALLRQSADRAGVTLTTTSGFRQLNPATGRDSAGSTSGRHTHGNASDTALFRDGRQLSVNNPEDVPYIQQFTRDFIGRARASGYQPSVGWGTEYMGGNVGHFDIASGRNDRPDGRGIWAGYWGNNEEAAGAVDWLPGLFNSSFDDIDFDTPVASTFSTRGAPAPDTTPEPRVQPASFTPPSSTAEIRPINRDSLSAVGTTQFNIRSGATGNNVTSLQRELQGLGYNVGSTGADGIYGQNTAAAVRNFQRDYGLQVDGIVGDQTMSALRQLRPTQVAQTPSTSTTAGA